MQVEIVTSRSGLARAISGKRIRCFSTAFILATAANIGASQGALGPTGGEIPQAAQNLAAPDVATPGIDIGDLMRQARALPILDEAQEPAPSIIVPSIEASPAKAPSKDAHSLDEAASLPDQPIYLPQIVMEPQEELTPGPDEIILSFTRTIQTARQNARAEMRHIREAIAVQEALAGSPDDILEFEEMKVARWIVDAVREASEVTGVDMIYMMALADKESSLIPDIAARTSSAEGLFQFIEQTWLECVATFGADHGLADEAEAISVDKSSGRRSVADAEERERILNLRRDPLIAGLMAGEMLKRDRARIEAAIERELTWHEMYMAHFLGAGGAIRLLKTAKESPKKTASSIFPAAARANRTLFFAGKGKGKAISVTQFQELIENMIAPRMERYASLEAAPANSEAAPANADVARASVGPLPRRLRAGS
jgi:hypothetical protein